MIVEDDGIQAVLLKKMLIKLGYSVLDPVATGSEAIAGITAEIPDLILMDIQLADDMNGIDTARYIHTVADVPIVFLTAYSQDAFIQRAKITIPYGYLIKPVSQRELAVTIEIALYRHQIDRQLQEHKHALQRARDELELRVQERTAELVSANEILSREIEKRKKAEERMFLSFETLNMFIDGISEPLFLLDADLRLRKYNRAAKDYYGLENFENTIIGKYCYEAFRGKSSPCKGCGRPFSELKLFSGVYERKNPFNPETTEQVFVDLVKDISGSPKAYIIRIYDITEKKKIDNQIAQNEKLFSLGLLVAGIAHEINNPNNFIYFNIPILRSYFQFLLPIVDKSLSTKPEQSVFGRPYSVFKEDCFKIVDNLEHGSTRINQILQNLKEFVHEQGRSKVHRIDLKQTVEKGVSICIGRIKKSVKNFEMIIPEELPQLLSDPLAIEQIVVNLLINAAQAADKKNSWIKLEIKRQQENENELLIEIHDNGCGMDAETRKKIFDPFFTTKPVGIGTGLGLPIVHRLVTELGGFIEVLSEVGKGSLFRVIFKIDAA